MRAFALLFATLSSLAAAAPADSAKPPSPPGTAAVFSEARLEKLDRFLDDSGYLGGVLLIGTREGIVHAHAFGYRDLARADPIARDDVFRIYSMTKTIASVAALLLMEEGRLTLDDPVGKHLPMLDRAGLTIRHLLTHTAGLPAPDLDDAPSLEAYVERLAKIPNDAPPGTRFEYGSAALEVLARIVEVVSRQAFDDFLRERLFEPLGMKDTTFEVPLDARDRVVDLTSMSPEGGLVIADEAHARTPGVRLRAYPSAAGGLYATADDYARFAAMLLAGGAHDGTMILGRKTVDLMMSNHLTMLDPPVTEFSAAEGFGLGGMVVLDPATRGVPGSVGQFGWPGAASTLYFVDRAEGFYAVLLMQHLPNGKPTDLPRISRPVQAMIYGALR